MSIRLGFDTHATLATLPRFRDAQPRPTTPADRPSAGKPADPIGLFTRDELRQMVLELLG